MGGEAEAAHEDEPDESDEAEEGAGEAWYRCCNVQWRSKRKRKQTNKNGKTTRFQNTVVTYK